MHRQKAAKYAKGEKVTRPNYQVNEVSYSTGARHIKLAESRRLTSAPQTSLPKQRLVQVIKAMRMMGTSKNLISLETDLIKSTKYIHAFRKIRIFSRCSRKIVTTPKGSTSRIFSNKDWDTFFRLTDNPPAPARALREAYRTYKEQFDSEE